MCMRLVALDGRGGVGRGRVACWASVATVAMCRHDPYSIYLMFAIVALSPDALECPGKYVALRFITVSAFLHNVDIKNYSAI